MIVEPLSLPPKRIYESLEEAKTALNQYAMLAGYALCTAKNKERKERRVVQMNCKHSRKEKS